MKREFLEGLGLESEKVEAIMKEHGTAISKLNTDLTNSKNEVQTLKTQIEDANKEIQSYKDMDIDSIKKSANDWETKYNELVANQKAEKEQSIKNERINEFFKDTKFSSEMAKAGVIAEFNRKDFKYDEDTKSFQGAKEWLDGLKGTDKGSFLSDVVNPSFSTVPSAPSNTKTNDELRQVMGLANKEK